MIVLLELRHKYPLISKIVSVKERTGLIDKSFGMFRYTYELNIKTKVNILLHCYDATIS